MQRDLRQLADTRFDVLVVGAGFYGVTTAWDAAQRGLSVAIIDKDDFGAATSFNNLKTLHGGLRSLQHLNFQQARLFVRERRALARIVPHLVRPLPFVVPTGVTGGAVWYDYQMQSTDRVTLSFLLSAIDAGAAAANYVRVTRFLQEHNRVIGVMAEDRMTRTTFVIRATVVVNAAGPWAASLLAGLPAAAQ